MSWPACQVVTGSSCVTKLSRVCNYKFWLGCGDICLSMSSALMVNCRTIQNRYVECYFSPVWGKPA